MTRSRSLALAAVAAAAGLTLLSSCQDGPKAAVASKNTPAVLTAETAPPGPDGTAGPAPGGPSSGPTRGTYSQGGQTPGPGQAPAPGQDPGSGQTPGPGQVPGSGQAPGSGGAPGTPPGGVPAKRFATPKEAAAYLVDAWRRGDRQAAGQAAGPNTVNKVFAVRYVATPIDECGPGAQFGSSRAFSCYHRYEGGSTSFDVDPYPASGYRVVNFTRTAD